MINRKTFQQQAMAAHSKCVQTSDKQGRMHIDYSPAREQHPQPGGFSL